MTAEIGRRLGFGYRKGPPRSLSFGVLRLTVHSGLVLDVGKWRLALHKADSLSTALINERDQLRAALESERAAHDESLLEMRDAFERLTNQCDEILMSRGH
ncbi:hypothetical protein [Gluconobacter morbifer]|uniref:Uncharacterized protein n=1 Tax=Gluconobacter morbifer G707 TaxID=1088869 RepID=G6XIX1_9PROT|nr:hypothetical protein [Gluconobacter morbifer]EHH68401.1 hypothetical protein GMO_11710 [Gluconobacter morbifer G707]